MRTLAVGLGRGEQRPAGAAELRLQDGAGLLEEQPHVHRHLVVAAARGVQLGRGRHPLRERLLDVHVHVLEPGVPRELAGLDLARDVVQPRADGVALLARRSARRAPAWPRGPCSPECRTSARRRSNETDSLNFSISAEGSAENRPPHVA